MPMPNQYWQERILKNQAMADKLADKVLQRQATLHKDLYKDLVKQVDSLFIEVTNAGVENISRTQLWQFSKWKALMDANYQGFTG
jgi:NADP-dependent 3-hydroxy acid dehydrogenase YdfG